MVAAEAEGAKALTQTGRTSPSIKNTDKTRIAPVIVPFHSQILEDVLKLGRRCPLTLAHIFVSKAGNLQLTMLAGLTLRTGGRAERSAECRGNPAQAAVAAVIRLRLAVARSPGKKAPGPNTAGGLNDQPGLYEDHGRL